MMSSYLDGDGVVDDHGLGKDGRSELRIREFGIEIEPKPRIIVNFLVTQHNVQSPVVI